MTAPTGQVALVVSSCSYALARLAVHEGMAASFVDAVGVVDAFDFARPYTEILQLLPHSLKLDQYSAPKTSRQNSTACL